MIQTIDDYIQKEFRRWLKASEEHFGRAIDPRESGEHVIQKSEDDYLVYRCLSLPEYLRSLGAIESLKDLDVEITPEIAEERSKGIRYLGLRIGPYLERLNSDRFEADEGQSKRKLEGVEKNPLIVKDLLHRVAGLKDNYGTYIFKFYEALKQSEIGRNHEIGRWRDTSWSEPGISFTVKKEVEEGYKWYEHEHEFDYVGQGFVNIGMREDVPNKIISIAHGDPRWTSVVMKCLADEIKKLGFSAHIDYMQSGNVTGGAFYDPSWNN